MGTRLDLLKNIPPENVSKAGVIYPRPKLLLKQALQTAAFSFPMINMSDSIIFSTTSKGFKLTYELGESYIRETRTSRLRKDKVTEVRLSELAPKFHQSERLNLDLGLLDALISLGAFSLVFYLTYRIDLKGKEVLSLAALWLPVLFRRKITEELIEFRELKATFRIVIYEEDHQQFDEFVEEVRVRVEAAQGN